MKDIFASVFSFLRNTLCVLFCWVLGLGFCVVWGLLVCSIACLVVFRDNCLLRFSMCVWGGRGGWGGGEGGEHECMRAFMCVCVILEIRYMPFKSIHRRSHVCPSKRIVCSFIQYIYMFTFCFQQRPERRSVGGDIGANLYTQQRHPLLKFVCGCV